MSIPISQLPADLVYNGQLDVSNPDKQSKYDTLNKAYEQNLGGTSTSGVDFSSIPSTQAYVQNQIASEDPYIKAIMDKYATAEKPIDIYTRLEQEAGIPQLRKTAGSLMGQVANIEDILDRIEPDVSERTRESLVTEAMRRGIVSEKKAPWIENLGKVGTSLGRIQEALGLARQDVGTKTSLTMQGLEQELKPLEFAYSVKVDRNARMLTGFTSDKETQLSLMLDKLERERQLDDREWELTQQLASDESNYLRELQTIAAKAGVSGLTGSESSQQLLSMIARTASATSGGSGSGTSTASEVARLKADVEAGATFEDLVRRYGSEISTSQIRSVYNENSRYGTAKESESQVQQWLLKPTSETETNKDLGTVRAIVTEMKNSNEDLETIKNYIGVKGFNASDFSDILSGYEPKQNFWEGWFQK